MLLASIFGGGAKATAAASQQVRVGGQTLVDGKEYSALEGPCEDLPALQAGIISYDSSENTLTLYGAEINAGDKIGLQINNTKPGMTIKVNGTCSITSSGYGLDLSSSVDIVKDGSSKAQLQFTSETSSAIYMEGTYTLTISDVDVTAYGQDYGINGKVTYILSLSSTTAEFWAYGKQACVNKIVLSVDPQKHGFYISHPAGAKYQASTQEVVDDEGNEIKNTFVRIKAGIAVNTTNFPDTYFYYWLLNQDYGKDKLLTEQEIANVTSIHMTENIFDLSGISGKENTADLTGIEYFTALESLHCNNLKMTSLDVSKNTQLQELICSHNELTSLDVSKNAALTVLSCNDNKLTSLDVPKSTLLTSLKCSNNELTTLDVSKNTQLQELNCSYNKLTDLDVSNNTVLTSLECSNNELTSLDVSKNTQLQELDCSYNKLTSLDVSKNTILKKLFCVQLQLTSLDISKNTALTVLYCQENQLTSLDVSNNTELKDLQCFINQLTTLNVSKNTSLETLVCYANQLTSLDVSDCKALETLVIYRNQLTSLDVSGCTALSKLYCYNNPIRGKTMKELINTLPSRLDLAPGTMYVSDVNRITTLQVNAANAKGWKVATSSDNDIVGNSPGIAIDATTFLDANFLAYVKETIDTDQDEYLAPDEIEAVKVMIVSSMKIADLTGIEYFTALTSLNCSGNHLTALDLSKNTALTSLDCSSNKLTTLDLSNNTKLETISCYGNNIREEQMDAFLRSLPSVKSGSLYIINKKGTVDNKMTVVQANVATSKGWSVYEKSSLAEYKGIGALPIDDKHFPDLKFRQWLLDQSFGKDGYLDDIEATEVESMNVASQEIADLTGIEYFTALKELDCSSNNLTTLDLSKNTALEALHCGGNAIRGNDMDALISSLPSRSTASAGTCDLGADTSTGNKVTTTQVAALKAKGWKAQTLDGSADVDYAGILDGDANGDGKVDVADIVAIISHKKGTAVAGFSLLAADINNDGTADEKDIELIKKMIMGE